MEYLNYKNSYENIKQTFMLIGIIFGALAAYLLGRTIWGERKLMALVMVLALGSLGLQFNVSV